jgi:hypothetical protein
MTFSPVFKAMLVSTFIMSAPSLSADLSKPKQQAERFSKTLIHSYHGQTSIEDFKVNAVKHQFVFSHGLVFTISTNIDDLITMKHRSRQDNTSNEQQQSIINKSPEKKESKKILNELRFQARNIAHQEFSLQKQIDSMQAQSKKSQNEQQKDAIDQKIRTNQDKMTSLVTEKRQVSRDIANYAKVAEQKTVQSDQVAREVVYSKLVKQSYVELCDDLALVDQLADNEQLTLVFENLGEVEAAGFKDKVVNINKTILQQCNNGELTTEQALKESYSYQY